MSMKQLAEVGLQRAQTRAIDAALIAGRILRLELMRRSCINLARVIGAWPSRFG